MNIPLGAESAEADIGSIVSGLRESRDVLHNVRYRGPVRPPPSREDIVETVAQLTMALFPAHYGRPASNGGALTPEMIDDYVGTVLSRALPSLDDQVRRTLPFTAQDTPSEEELHGQASAITRAFAAGLPAIRGLLVSDLKAAYTGDPAATGYSEILLVYPGMTALIHYRLAHALHALGATFLARQICEIAHSQTGIDIHPAAEIGGSFFIDHGTGVVIGATAVIGERVRLYQAVTLGARSFPTDGKGALVKGRPRHPIVEDDVVIYAGATILGRITIGRGSTIGGSVWLTHSVPPNSQITQAQLRSDQRQDRQG
ncbi:MAG: serine acetyltransferase [Alphaproteobacteria bacterium]|nr:serine acetyltransferase [Alphaproteobacteria bacterium]MBV8408403.1 serine acetyltransferase [Alphaproteobacteria bacterium]